MVEASTKVVWTDVPVPQTSTTVYEALIKRRMAWKWLDKAVPRDAVERMLSTAVWAPNHKHTEPWRFYVMEKDSPLRNKVADFAKAAVLKQNAEDATRADRMRAWVLNQPLLIFAFSVPGIHEEMTRENYAATVCAMHNVNLAGVVEGLAVTWETGGVAKLPGLAEAVGGQADWQLVCMATVGYGDEESKSERTPVDAFTTWA